MATEKPYRSDSVLGNILPEDKEARQARQEQIAQWVITCKKGDRYEYARKQLEADGVKVSRTAVFNWFQGWQLRQRFSSAEAFSLEVQDLLKTADLNLTLDQLDKAGQLAFTKKSLDLDDPEEFREMQYLKLAKETAKTKARQKDKDIALSERRVSLLEENAAAAKEKLTALASKGGLSPETLATIEEAAKLL